MKQIPDSLLRLLKCPSCADGPLQEGADAALTCSSCGRSYPIISGTPDLLPESGAFGAGGPLEEPAGQKRMDIDSCS